MLVVLKKIITICKENDISYTVGYGTLLGTIRHKGFIPWDDDCDIVMLRPEYDRFVQYCNDHQETLKPYKLLNRFNTPHYPFGISRLSNMDYYMIREDGGKTDMGIFVDIYPYDGYGVDLSMAEKRRKKNKYYTRMATYAALPHYVPSQRKLTGIIRRPAYTLAKVKGLAYYLDKMEKSRNRFSYANSELVNCLTWGSDRATLKRCYMDLMTGEFEGIQVSIPRDYDLVLKTHYGDYMKLPPEEARKESHGYKIYRKEK